MNIYLSVLFIAFFLVFTSNSFAILPPLTDVQTTTQSSGGQTNYTFKVFDQQRNLWKESQTGSYQSNKITPLTVVDGVVSWIVDANTIPNGNPNYRGYCSVYDPNLGNWITKFTTIDGNYVGSSLKSKNGTVTWSSTTTNTITYRKHYFNIYDPAVQSWREIVSTHRVDSIYGAGNPVLGDGVFAWTTTYQPSIGSSAFDLRFWTLAYNASASAWSIYDHGYSFSTYNSFNINSIVAGTINYNIGSQNYIYGYNPYSSFAWGFQNTGPIAKFSTSQTSGAIPLKVYFWNMSIGGSSYSWDFGNGSTSSVQSPFYTYNSAFGSPFTATLTVTGPGGTRTATQTITPTSPNSISGTVSNPSGFKVSGATVTLTGTNSATTQTDSNGNYSFANLTSGGNYTVGVSKTRYVFSPSSLNFSNLNGNQTGNFTGKLNDKQSDFDGDGKTDLSIFRPNSGDWWIYNSATSSPSSVNLGISSDRITPRDFDGDGKTDVAVWRSSNGIWYVLRSSDLTISYTAFGTTGDIPVAGDYDGDDKADVAVFRPSDNIWYILPTSTAQFYGIQYGFGTDLTVPGDYDGDNKTDIAVFRPDTAVWYIFKSSDSNSVAFQFGNTGDKPTQGDYDGDGKTDLATYRPGDQNWRINRSSDAVVTTTYFGFTTDQLAPGDYDGDGKTDIGVFRASTGEWYAIKSSDQTLFTSTFGTSGDLATQTSYIPQ